MSEQSYSELPIDDSDDVPGLEFDPTGLMNDEAVSFIEEPPVLPDDTQPKPPSYGSKDATVEPVSPPDMAALAPPPDMLYRTLAAEEPPIRSQVDTAEIFPAPAPARTLMLALVMLSTVCLCLVLVSFSSFAGYRDGLATNDIKITHTLATGIAEQYATGVADLTQGYAELAAARFGWIVETVQPPAEYARDSAQLLATARAISSYTPTLPPTETATLLPSPTPTLSSLSGQESAPTPTPNPMEDPAYLYQQAATAMSLIRYEDAIEWLEALQALAPDYRSEETRAMLIEALTQQGRIYLRGQNKDGEDKLARGVLLIYWASDLGPVEPNELLGEAYFAESYINARNYVAGGQYAAALPILEDLCAMNCNWGYPNYAPVTVNDLLEQARRGAQ